MNLNVTKADMEKAEKGDKEDKNEKDVKAEKYVDFEKIKGKFKALKIERRSKN